MWVLLDCNVVTRCLRHIISRAGFWLHFAKTEGHGVKIDLPSENWNSSEAKNAKKCIFDNKIYETQYNCYET